MPPLRRKRKSKICAPTTVLFTQDKNEDGEKQLCVFAQCHYSGHVHGPIWGHSDASVRRCLASMKNECPCGRRFHKKRLTEGSRILNDR